MLRFGQNLLPCGPEMLRIGLHRLGCLLLPNRVHLLQRRVRCRLPGRLRPQSHDVSMRGGDLLDPNLELRCSDCFTLRLRRWLLRVPQWPVGNALRRQQFRLLPIHP